MYLCDPWDRSPGLWNGSSGLLRLTGITVSPLLCTFCLLDSDEILVSVCLPGSVLIALDDLGTLAVLVDSAALVLGRLLICPPDAGPRGAGRDLLSGFRALFATGIGCRDLGDLLLRCGEGRRCAGGLLCWFVGGWCGGPLPEAGLFQWLSLQFTSFQCNY